MRSILFIIALLAITVCADAQKWVPGHFTDVKGNIQNGLIRINPPGRSPIRNEAFIEFKENEKAEPFKLSTGDLQSFVMGRDSFVVAHAPGNSSWSNKEFDFVDVLVDAPIRLYALRGGRGNGGGSGFSISPGIGFGFGGGSGGFGAGVGGGISIPIGGRSSRLTFYYGENTAAMQEITPYNFIEVMTDIMGDEPEIADAIRNNQYNLGNIDRLIARFDKARASHGS